MHKPSPALGALFLSAAFLCVEPAAARAQAPPKQNLEEEDDSKASLAASLTEMANFTDRFGGEHRVGFWMDGSYRDTDLSGEGNSLTYNHVNVQLDSRWGRWQSFIEAEFENIPNVTGGTNEREEEIEQIYLQYNHTDGLRVRGGRFNTPFGYWTPIHWSILMDTIEIPIHEKNRLVPEQQLGARLFGDHFPEWLAAHDTQLSYSMYAGYGNDNWGEPNPGNEDGSFGMDARILIDENLLAGFSHYRQKNADWDDRREKSTMVYGEFSFFENWLFRTEYFHQRRDHRRRTGFNREIDIVYAKLRWDFTEHLYANYRFTYGDDDGPGFTSKDTIHTTTFGIRPTSYLLVKCEYSAHDYRNSGLEDYNFWGLSVGYIFK